MPTTFTSLRSATTLVVGSVLTVVGVITGASFSGPSGSDTTVTSQADQNLVLQLEDVTFRTHVAPEPCTATGGDVTYDTCYMASPLTTTGSLREVTIECGNVATALPGDLSFVKTANAATGTSLKNFDNVTLGTGAYIYYLSGATLWNPADKLKFATLTTPTGTLNATRYNCKIRATVDDIYGR